MSARNVFHIILRPVVETYLEELSTISDAELDVPWTWMEYQEGVRFSFFRVYEILRQLNVQLRIERVKRNALPNAAQRFLANYAGACWRLRSLMLGVDEDILDSEPAPGEWSIRKVFSHIIETEWYFRSGIHHVLQQGIPPDEESTAPTNEEWDAYYVEQGGYTRETFNGPLHSLLAFFNQQNQRVLDELALIPASRLNWRIPLWETAPMDLRFRLNRLESHCCQHIIQIQKNLAALDQHSSETLLLLQMIYAGMADVEGSMIGAADLGEPIQRQAADEIIEITSSIRKII